MKRWAVQSYYAGKLAHETQHWTRWGAEAVAKAIRPPGRSDLVEIRVVRL